MKKMVSVRNSTGMLDYGKTNNRLLYVVLVLDASFRYPAKSTFRALSIVLSSANGIFFWKKKPTLPSQEEQQV